MAGFLLAILTSLQKKEAGRMAADEGSGNPFQDEGVGQTNPITGWVR